MAQKNIFDKNTKIYTKGIICQIRSAIPQQQIELESYSNLLKTNEVL